MLGRWRMAAAAVALALGLAAGGCVPPEVRDSPLADPSPDKGAQGTIAVAVPTGHEQVADALRRGFAARNPAAQVELVPTGATADVVLEGRAGRVTVQVAADAANPAGGQAFAAFVASPDGRLLIEAGR